MDSQVIGAIIGAVATIIAAVIGRLLIRRTERKLQQEKWYTQWRFSRTHHEELELKISTSGKVSGTRITTEEGHAPKKYEVTGYKQDSFYWLEYHLNSGEGGGAITLQKFTPGQLVGLVTSVDCNGTLLQCRKNHWLPYDERLNFESKWDKTLASVPTPNSISDVN